MQHPTANRNGNDASALSAYGDINDGLESKSFAAFLSIFTRNLWSAFFTVALVLCTVSWAHANGQGEETCQTLQKSEIRPERTMSASGLISTDPNDHLFSTAKLKLEYTRDQQTDIEGGTIWEYILDVVVYPDGTAAGATNHTLRISFGAEDYTYVSQELITNITTNELVMEVQSIEAQFSTNGGASFQSVSGDDVSQHPMIPGDIQLSFCTIKEFYTYLNPALAGIVSYNHVSETIQWQAQEPALEYDVEWVFIDALDEEYTNLQSAGVAAPFNYKEPTRIRTSDLSFFLPLIYPEGMLYCRVRPVGRFVQDVNGDYSHIKTGSWGYTNSSGAVARYEIDNATAFEDDKIWQYQVAYAEDGKNKRTVAYHDGLLRQRQVATNINSEDVSLVAETKYDHEGRPAVSILPAPVSGFDLSYRPNFNRASNHSSSFEKEHFDKASPEALSNQHGTAQYYSTNNPFTSDPFRDVLPQAYGYPYVQTQYVNDNTGRIRAVSGVGATHKLGSGRDTKTFYGTPTSTELHRLFGDNVGKASHYKKTLTLDPNRQGSVAYLDQQGRTIATALVGNSPDNLVSLGATAANITVSLVDNNVTDLSEGEITSVHRVLNQANTAYSFNYELDGSFFVQTVSNPNNPTSTTNLCVDCKYELEISITDPNGDPVDLISGSTIVQSISKTYTSGTLSCSSNGTYSFPAERFDAVFSEVGEYVVHKVLRAVVDDDAMDALTDNAMNDLGITLADLTNAHIAAIDSSACDFTCEQHCLTKVLDENPTWQVGTHDGLIDAAVEACINTWCLDVFNAFINEPNEHGETIECEAMREVMEEDVSPGGWLFLTSQGSDFWICMNDKIDNGDFLLADGTTAELSQVRDPQYWNEAWELLAVECHREYCHHETCVELQGSKQYDQTMAFQPDWVVASNSGYTNPLSAPNKDPFMDLSISQAMTLFGTNYSSGTTYHTIMQGQMNSYHNGQSLASYVTNSSSDLYVAPNATPFTDKNKWAIFMGIYFSLKQDLIEQVKQELGCDYYTDENAIAVAPKDLSDPAVQSSIANLGSSFFSGGCEDLCQMNVIAWMLELEAEYPTELSDPTTYADISAALLDWCLNNPEGCGGDNPFGLLTNTMANEGDLDDLIALFGENGMAIDSILVEDPNDPCAQPEQYILMPTAFAQAAFYVFQNHFFPLPASGYHAVDLSTVPDNQHNVLLNSLEINLVDGTIGTGGNFFGFNGQHCGIYLFDDEGDPIDLNTLSGVSNLHAITTQPSGYPTSTVPQLAYHFTQLVITVTLTSGGTVTAYLYYTTYGSVPSGFNSGNCYPHLASFTEVDTIPCVAALDPALLPATPLFNAALVREGCLDMLMAQAIQNAEQEYAMLRDNVRSQILENYYAMCLGDQQDEVFSATYILNEYHYTLYYYDMAGNLKQTVPPEGVEILDNTAFDADGAYIPGTSPEHRMPTRYAYNSLGQVIKQRTPDGGQTDFHYNDAGQLRYSQNAEQRPNDDFSYTKYDALGRIVEVGESNTSLEAAGLTASIDDMNYPATAAWEVTRTFYDEAAFALPAGSFNSAQQHNTRNRVSAATYARGSQGTASYPVATDISSATHYSYDIHGNVDELVQERTFFERTGGVLKHMSYDYDLISGNVNEVHYQEGHDDAFHHCYAYDGDNRIVAVATSRDGHLWDQDAAYEYFKHGPLARTEIGEDVVQAQDFAYTLHGWLKSVNASTGREDLDPGHDGYTEDLGNVHRYHSRDAYGYSLGYYDHLALGNGKDYTAINSSHVIGVNSNQMNPQLFATAKLYQLYNGNIGHLTYALPDIEVDSRMEIMFKGFEYDQLNRISQMRTMQSNTRGASDFRATNLIGTGDRLRNNYKTTYRYDANGNIISLKRNGYLAHSLTMDDLTYHYATNSNGEVISNKLRGVNDIPSYTNIYSGIDIDNDGTTYPAGGALSSDNYQYDNIGNLIHDGAEEIETISWNISGKIDKITRTAGSTKPDLEFRYDPTGNRIAKIEKPRNSGSASAADDWEITTYVRDASGNVMATYTETFVSTESTNQYKARERLNDHPLYGSKRLGIAKPAQTIEQERSFTASPNTSGFGIVTTMNQTQSLGSNIDFEIQQAGSGVTMNIPAQAQLTLSALGADLEISGVFTLVASQQQIEGIYVLSKGSTATISPTLSGGLNLLSQGSFSFISTASVSLTSQGSLQVTQLPAVSNIHESDRVLEHKAYELTDHLGNVLATVSDRQLGIERDERWGYYVAQVYSATDYYPFGMVMPGRNLVSDDYQYGFNGKENDDEVKGDGNQLDYGFRIYDPRVARFLSMDPLSPYYPMLTPYQFASNTPVQAVDIDGLEGKDYRMIMNVNGFEIVTKRVIEFDVYIVYRKSSVNDPINYNEIDTKRIQQNLDGTWNVGLNDNNGVPVFFKVNYINIDLDQLNAIVSTLFGKNANITSEDLARSMRKLENQEESEELFRNTDSKVTSMLGVVLVKTPPSKTTTRKGVNNGLTTGGNHSAINYKHQSYVDINFIEGHEVTHYLLSRYFDRKHHDLGGNMNLPRAEKDDMNNVKTYYDQFDERVLEAVLKSVPDFPDVHIPNKQKTILGSEGQSEY